jgi:hypothetical protein
MRNSHAGWMTRGLVLVGVVLMAGCATTGATLSNSAERLERSSTQLERNADEMRVRTHARELADESRDFRHVVTDSRADRRDVRGAFDDLSRSYHALRDAVEKTRDHGAERDFDAVTSVYLDIEREVNLNDRYATLTD